MSVDDSVGNVDDSLAHHDDWEAEIRSALEGTEYDADLGVELAMDAQQLAAGEITESEFRETYDEDIVANLESENFFEHVGSEETELEMVEDLRTAGGTFLEALNGVSGNSDASRREVMKKMSAGAAFLGLGALTVADDGGDARAAMAAQDGETDRDTQYGMVIDLERCDGCLGCVEGCYDENNLRPGANWMYALSYKDEDNHKTAENPGRLVRPCQHCSEAACEQVCPTTARHTRPEDGLVLTDYDVCIGCRYCQVGCPYGVNYFAWDAPEMDEDEHLEENHDHVYDNRDQRVDMRPPRGVMGKCTMCPTRQDGNMGEEAVGTVACMDACDAMGMSAIHFGDLKDPESRPNQYIRHRLNHSRQELEELEDDGVEVHGDGNDGGNLPGASPTDDAADDQPDWLTSNIQTSETGASTFRLLEEMGTKPNIIYIGDEPGPNAEELTEEEYDEEAPVYDWSYRQANEQGVLLDSDEHEIVSNRKEVLDEETIGGGLGP
ncbi:4Fe-4S ferredoxin N-terminal domain-containing protein [Natrialbaceae archaeon A-gly3]